MEEQKQFINLIKQIINEELDKRDNTKIAKVVSVNTDGTIDISVVPNDDTVLRNIKNESKYVFQTGDYCLLFLIKNRLSNSFIITKLG